MAQHLLVAADQFELARLRAICEQRLCETVDEASVSTTLTLAEQNHAGELKRVCLEFMSSSDKLDSVMASEGFQHMLASCPHLQVCPSPPPPPPPLSHLLSLPFHLCLHAQHTQASLLSTHDVMPRLRRWRFCRTLLIAGGSQLAAQPMEALTITGMDTCTAPGGMSQGGLAAGDMYDLAICRMGSACWRMAEVAGGCALVGSEWGEWGCTTCTRPLAPVAKTGQVTGVDDHSNWPSSPYLFLVLLRSNRPQQIL